MKRRVLLFVAFGCLGTTTEVFFTGLTNALTRFARLSILDLTLVGTSYVWMFFIYGTGSILFPSVYRYSRKYRTPIRLLLYSVVIFAVEFVTGFLLDFTIGHCPWEYHTKWSVFGYIRLDYIFYWMFFGFVFEKIYLFLDGLVDRLPTLPAS
jgi:uncharacterized membrane protein